MVSSLASLCTLWNLVCIWRSGLVPCRRQHGTTWHVDNVDILRGTALCKPRRPSCTIRLCDCCIHCCDDCAGRVTCPGPRRPSFARRLCEVDSSSSTCGTGKSTVCPGMYSEMRSWGTFSNISRISSRTRGKGTSTLCQSSISAKKDHTAAHLEAQLAPLCLNGHSGRQHPMNRIDMLPLGLGANSAFEKSETQRNTTERKTARLSRSLSLPTSGANWLSPLPSSSFLPLSLSLSSEEPFRQNTQKTRIFFF